METKKIMTSLQRLIATPKGCLRYSAGESFLLHVFWEVPSSDLAKQLLEALQRCADATHRDTPCVPIYFFRVSSNNADLCSPVPYTVSDHPQLRAALAKLAHGVPAPAVRADIARRGLDPALLDIGPSGELPEKLRCAPVSVECTELYLDEHAFMEHAGSREYLDAYGAVMQPGLQNARPQTVRLGTPTASLVDRILDPILAEIARPLPSSCHLWRQPDRPVTSSAVLLSLDVMNDKSVVSEIPPEFRAACTTCVAFDHPLREHTVRVMCVLPELPPADLLKGLAEHLDLLRGEAHVAQIEQVVVLMRETLDRAMLGSVVVVNSTPSAGYILHARAAQIEVK